ncbi:hypothetical protein [Streptomyces sp. S1D4-20]|uniref:hypothetical protein n=1 Tax=Streptomyces sp. S1D4-20 TaxID=2594462 RepID=UPI001162B46F|nr:hypothetical protein [Streptomyces sp. S1D4-20]QDN54063.1 hypothetical protein FNV67_00340 [Streptomyces sp. S1D4-20]
MAMDPRTAALPQWTVTGLQSTTDGWMNTTLVVTAVFPGLQIPEDLDDELPENMSRFVGVVHAASVTEAIERCR